MEYGIGRRIRKLRRQQDRTLQDIADVCGFTRSLLCKIEAGSTVPPISTLSKIASALGVQVANLLSDGQGTGTVHMPVSKSSGKKMTRTEKGYSFFAFASDRQDKLMQPYLFVAEKGKVLRKPLSHSGEEFVFVLEGSMKYKVGSVEYTLSQGDSLYFDAEEDHDLEPITSRVRYLAVFTERKEN